MRALRRCLYWLPAATWMALIYLGSTGLLAESRTSRFIAPFLRWLLPGIAEDTVGRIVLFTRKCAHAGEYGLLAGLVWAALNGSFRPLPRAWSWTRAGGALLICSAYAVTDEVHQSFVPSRFGNPTDVLIDTAGAAAALLLLWLYGRWRRRANVEAGLHAQTAKAAASARPAG